MNFLRTVVFRAWITFCYAALPALNLNLLQQESETRPTPQVDDTDWDALTTAIEARTDVGGISNQQLREAVERAKKNRERAIGLNNKAQQIDAEAAGAMQRAASLRQQITTLDSQRTPDFSSRGDDWLEKRKNELRKQINQLQPASEETNPLRQRKSLRDRLLNAQQELSKAKTGVDSPANGTETGLVADIERLEKKTIIEVWQGEIRKLQSELAKVDADEAADLPRIERERNQKQLAAYQAELAAIDQTIETRRQETARNTVAQTELAIERTHPAIRSIALRNRDLALENRQLNQDIDLLRAELSDAQSTRDRWKTQIEQTQKKVDTIGLNTTIGSLLRRARTSLPDLGTVRETIRGRQPRIESAELSLLTLEEEATVPEEEIVDQTLRENRDQFQENERESLRAQARELVDKQREILKELTKNKTSYVDLLYELNTTDEEQIQSTSEFAKYIDQRVLWIRSSRSLLAHWPIRSDVFWFLERDRWSELIPSLISDVLDNPLIYVAIVLFQLLLFAASFRLRKEATSIGQAVKKNAVTKFAPTIRVAIITLLLSIPTPVLFLFLGWRTSEFADGGGILSGLSAGFMNLALVLFPLEFAREMFRVDGLADAHLKWPSKSLGILRRNLRFLIVFGLPLVFVTTVLDACRPQKAPEWAERICFILAAIILALFLARILNPRKGAIAPHLLKHSGGWLDRLRHVWYWLVVAIPLALGGLAFTGYYYTAQQLAWRLYLTICLFFGLVTIKALLNRWFLLQRRRILIQELKRKRELAAKQELQGEAVVDPSPDEFTVSAEDLKQQTEQSRRLLSTVGFLLGILVTWFTWNDVLPALEFLERWPLWETTAQVSETTDGETGESLEVVRRVVDKITIADVAFAILIVIVTIIAARNLPGTLEMVFLQRLPIEKSLRYAVTTLTSYLIVAIGIIFACSVIGLHWSQIQWIATALTFGLAFGLQEMFANFIAGIIVLFERPIRVGDVVTIGDTTGTVARIRMRATKIISFDRKDFLVPNKEFITGRLLNWTLSDQISRLDINVGVAYGSDTTLVKKLLLDAANDHPDVLDEPAPWAMFESFGDSSLNYILRPYVGSMDKRTTVKNELHESINRSFQQAGIEMPFPQRDVNLSGSIDLQSPPPQK